MITLDSAIGWFLVQAIAVYAVIRLKFGDPLKQPASTAPAQAQAQAQATHALAPKPVANPKKMFQFILLMLAMHDILTFVKQTPTYYDILGVSPAASAAEIKAGYRAASLTHHPDRTGGESEEFLAVARAYDVLRDPDSRRRYDMFGAEVIEKCGPARCATHSDYVNVYLETHFLSKLGIAISCLIPIFTAPKVQSYRSWMICAYVWSLLYSIIWIVRESNPSTIKPNSPEFETDAMWGHYAILVTWIFRIVRHHDGVDRRSTRELLLRSELELQALKQEVAQLRAARGELRLPSEVELLAIQEKLSALPQEGRTRAR
ncbi:hypothetical protein CAOG_007925 [Capsaspora owczarzaki ATCC 30864]|uniref:J domain-containing protein n=1 Tax=Capsaspora owczarzaki (strain ATCC 30864) TaxID=595528 RepID=A0A0D2X5H9_CAPO3|nr:hypothetical protein CAOG_007925 [Capsaspora owczarzaki ATCC 30864]